MQAVCPSVVFTMIRIRAAYGEGWTFYRQRAERWRDLERMLQRVGIRELAMKARGDK
jgi:hypothetical protein